MESHFSPESDDIEVLKRSLEIADEHLERERDRDDLAEHRTRTLIIFTGVATSAIVASSNLLTEIDIFKNIHFKLLLFIALVFLIKAVYFTFKAFEVKKYNRLTPDLIKDIQSKDIKDALRYEIKWKIWEYYQKVDFIRFSE